MTGPTRASEPTPAIDLAIVLRADDEESCAVLRHGESIVVPYATPFPRPRSDRVAPGHLVAIANIADRDRYIIWRWFDAVVVGPAGSDVLLWEPLHGEVVARPRTADRLPQLGTRAYLSSGLPGADWWLAGQAVGSADKADVEVDDVANFFTTHDLWSKL